MADIFDTKKRSDIMSKVKSSNTKPELIVRRYLHSKGIRYSLHKKSLPGKPDIFSKKYNAAIFVNGCFWHGHKNCKLSKLPKSNADFWVNKINRNKKRDSINYTKICNSNYRVLIVWSCSFRNLLTRKAILKEIMSWLTSGGDYNELPRQF